MSQARVAVRTRESKPRWITAPDSLIPTITSTRAEAKVKARVTGKGSERVREARQTVQGGGGRAEKARSGPGERQGGLK